MKPNRILRTFRANVIAGGNSAFLAEVTEVNHALIPATSVQYGEVLDLSGLPWTTLIDHGDNHPIFDFFSSIKGTQRADDGDKIHVLIELFEGKTEFKPLHWAQDHEYQKCMAGISSRKEIGRHNILAPKARKQQAWSAHVDTSKYLFKLPGGAGVYNTPLEISLWLYKTYQLPQEKGWPIGTWQTLSGKTLKGCNAPRHPGPNFVWESPCRESKAA